MAFTYDVTTSRGKVRRLIGDVDTAVAANQVFTDDEIDAFLSLSSSDLFDAAAMALEAMAADQALFAIAYSLLGQQTRMDRTKVHAALLAAAERMKARAGQDDTTDEFVEWPLLVSNVDGRDESDYYSTDDAEYYQKHHWDDEG